MPAKLEVAFRLGEGFTELPHDKQKKIIQELSMEAGSYLLEKMEFLTDVSVKTKYASSKNIVTIEFQKSARWFHYLTNIFMFPTQGWFLSKPFDGKEIRQCIENYLTDNHIRMVKLSTENDA